MYCGQRDVEEGLSDNVHIGRTTDGGPRTRRVQGPREDGAP